MAWIDEGAAIVLANLNNSCPICKTKIKKGPKYLQQMKAVRLKRQQPVEQKIWESLWDAAIGACSLGSVPTYGSQFRKTRYICPKCGRQFVLLENGKYVETVYSKFLRI